MSYKECQKIEVERELGQVKTETLLAQIIPDKIFGSKWSDLVKLDRKRKVFACFLTAIR